MSENVRLCPHCRRGPTVTDAAFCPYCGGALAASAPLPEAAERALEAVKKTGDPVKKHRLLTEALTLCPDCLPLEEELLFLGRLHERDRRKPSYDVIKCYLLHFYLTPESFSPAKTDAMRRELFHHEQLERCKRLSPDPELFLRRYLERLSEEFIELFLEGSSYYMRSFLGFTSHRNAPRLLAEPAAEMLARMNGDRALTPEERDMLTRAFYRAFSLRTNGQTSWLQELLKRRGIDLE